jgi:hypothetical protein
LKKKKKTPTHPHSHRKLYKPRNDGIPTPSRRTPQQASSSLPAGCQQLHERRRKGGRRKGGRRKRKTRVEDRGYTTEKKSKRKNQEKQTRNKKRIHTVVDELQVNRRSDHRERVHFRDRPEAGQERTRVVHILHEGVHRITVGLDARHPHTSVFVLQQFRLTDAHATAFHSLLVDVLEMQLHAHTQEIQK